MGSSVWTPSPMAGYSSNYAILVARSDLECGFVGVESLAYNSIFFELRKKFALFV